MATETTKTKSEEIEQLISELKQKDIDIPSWEDLKKEYFPSLHPVMTDTSYRDKPSSEGLVKVTRVTRGLQRRAVNIITGMMFGIQVKRVYSNRDEAEKKASEILEKIFEANRIDTVNLARAMRYFAACEVATLWYAIKEENSLYGEKGKLKIRCRNFSPFAENPDQSGETIYPKFDEYGDMVALSFEYTRKEKGKDAQYFDTYTNTDHIKYRRGNEGWEVVEEDKIETINKIPAVYAYRPTPIWEESSNVTEIEWAKSRNGNYLRKNSVPVFTVFSDEDVEYKKQSDSDERLILQFSSNAKAGYATWEQAIESLKYHVDGLERDFFSDIQIPDFSNSEMSGAGASGESKRYMFVEAIIKVIHEKGPWLEFFSREVNVIKAFAKLAFPKEKYPELNAAFDSLTVEHIVTPFEISNENENINNIATAVQAGIAAKKTGVARLGWVKDVDEEMNAIESESIVDFTEKTV